MAVYLASLEHKPDWSHLTDRVARFVDWCIQYKLIIQIARSDGKMSVVVDYVNGAMNGGSMYHAVKKIAQEQRPMGSGRTQVVFSYKKLAETGYKAEVVKARLVKLGEENFNKLAELAVSFVRLGGEYAREAQDKYAGMLKQINDMKLGAEFFFAKMFGERSGALAPKTEFVAYAPVLETPKNALARDVAGIPSLDSGAAGNAASAKAHRSVALNAHPARNKTQYAHASGQQMKVQEKAEQIAVGAHAQCGAAETEKRQPAPAVHVPAKSAPCVGMHALSKPAEQQLAHPVLEKQQPKRRQAQVQPVFNSIAGIKGQHAASHVQPEREANSAHVQEREFRAKTNVAAVRWQQETVDEKQASGGLAAEKEEGYSMQDAQHIQAQGRSDAHAMPFSILSIIIGYARMSMPKKQAKRLASSMEPPPNPGSDAKNTEGGMLAFEQACLQ